jgi:hypothetical protein
LKNWLNILIKLKPLINSHKNVINFISTDPLYIYKTFQASPGRFFAFRTLIN